MCRAGVVVLRLGHTRTRMPEHVRTVSHKGPWQDDAWSFSPRGHGKVASLQGWGMGGRDNASKQIPGNMGVRAGDTESERETQRDRERERE